MAKVPSPIKPRNVFAAAGSTQFNVTNNTNGMLGNQAIMVFATPLSDAENWEYAAWQSLTPGDGSTKSFILNQTVSGSMSSEDDLYTTALQPINPGYVAVLTNAAGLDPTLGTQVLGNTVADPTVTSTQSGLKNMTNSPATSMYAEWYLNGGLLCKSTTLVEAGGTLSAFELNTVLYFAVGTSVIGPSYTYNQITVLTPLLLPANTPVVNVVVTFNQTTQEFDFAFTPASAA